MDGILSLPGVRLEMNTKAEHKKFNIKMPWLEVVQAKFTILTPILHPLDN